MKLTLIYCLAALIACSAHSPSVAVDAAPAPDDGVTGGRDTTGRWLYVSSLGVAFSKLPVRGVRTRTLEVRSTHGPPEVAWTAQSDQGWLWVTPSGMTGGSLVLTANPTGLQPDHQYIANVHVSSSDSTIRNEQTVRVGLWIGSADPQPVTLNTFIPYIVADPVLPYVYTNTRGTDITVYDVYSGAPVRTFMAAVTTGGTMAISSDGMILFVNDTANRRVVALDTSTGSMLRVYTWASIESSGIGYARPNAHPILMIGNGKVFDVETGVPYTSMSRITDGSMEDVSFDVDPYGQYAYVQDHGEEPSELRQFSIDYDVQRADPLITTLRHSVRGNGFGQTICVAADGSRVYAASSLNGPVSIPAFSADGLVQIQTLPGGGANTACGWNGLFFGGDGSNVSVYRKDGTPAGTFSIAAAPGTLVLSGDNTRIIGSLDPFLSAPSFNIRNTSGP